MYFCFQRLWTKICKSWQLIFFGQCWWQQAGAPPQVWVCRGQQVSLFPCYYHAWCGYNALLLCGYETFHLLILAFPGARPSEVQAFLVYFAVLTLEHQQKPLVWLEGWLWLLCSVPNTPVNSWVTIASQMTVVLWELFHPRAPFVSLSWQWLVPWNASSGLLGCLDVMATLLKRIKTYVCQQSSQCRVCSLPKCKVNFAPLELLSKVALLYLES